MNIYIDPQHIHLVKDSCFEEVPPIIEESEVQNTILVGGKHTKKKRSVKRTVKRSIKRPLKRSVKRSVRRPRKKYGSKTKSLKKLKKSSMNAKNNRFRSRVYRAYSKRR
jgi:hypothetical protein